MRVLVFGASTTQGYWDTEGGWVTRLRRYYDEKQVKLQAAGNVNEGQPAIFNLGISADMSSDVLKRFEPETVARQRGELAFIFCVGGNDSAIENSKPRATTEDYKSNIETLIKKARQFSDKIMVIGLNPVDETRTTPVFWADVHYTNEGMKSNNNTLMEVCKKENIPYVSIFEDMEKRFKAGEEMFVDGLHPNNEGHELIFQLVQPALDQLLNT
ncbi:hypothetical protein HYW36_02510 [Candidatus Saccharibacteria bacterium]|nr:hypothetical protein [Candidatus Saccharibacteria bacterium]